MKTYDKMYIGGKWVEPVNPGRVVDVVDSATEEVVGQVLEGGVGDVDAAVAAARAGFDSWSATPSDVRSKYLRDIGAALGERSREIATLIASEVGMPITSAEFIQAGLSVGDWANYADALDNYEWERQVGNSIVAKEPIGVIGCITPWNYPLFLTVCKVAPALAAGCTVVLKPAAITPLNAFLLAEVLEQVGLPAGVFNLVPGAGTVVGAAIAAHPDVDMVSFTGSGPVGRDVATAAAGNFKRVHLELGGKSANIVLDDADPAAIAPGAVFGCFLNSGQTCSALTRVLVPRSRKQEFIDAIVAEASQARLVDPAVDDFDLFHAFGPLVSRAQQESVREFIQKGIDEGASLLVGGPEQPDEFPTGFYVKPTVFADVTPDMTIAREEIFGPVLSIIDYDDDDDAVRIANDSIFGLAGAVQSGDLERAKAVARRMRTGQVDVNGGSFNPVAPFGGYKQSGNGRERGVYALDEYMEIKSMQLP